MRPNLLKISGVNSFSNKEPERIEFYKLIDKGLFGIFGPTGSGKSTILDGITLALYGKVARDNTSNSYINSDESVKKAYIYFEFFSGHGDNEKRYVVERTIKKVESGVQTAKVTLETYDLNDNMLSIIEKRGEVEKELIENVIKLSFYDFIKTVVLPQGKFSDFLTLAGAKRNEMLERILGLEEYGESLTAKIKYKKAITNDRLNYLDGELGRYKEISQEKIDELEKELKQIKKEKFVLKIKIAKLEEQCKKYKKIYDLQQELNKYLNMYEETLKNKDDIFQKEKRLKKGKDALHISPYINTFDKSIQEQEENTRKWETLNIELEELSKEIEVLNQQYTEAYELKEKEYPELVKKGSKLETAIELEKEKIDTQKLLIIEEKELEVINNKIQSLEKHLNDITDKKLKIEKEMNEIQEIISKKNISSSYKEKLIDGLEVEKKYTETYKSLKEKEEEYSNTNKRVVIGQIKIEELDKELEKLEKDVEEKKLEYISLNKILLSKEDLLKRVINKIEQIKDKSLAAILAQKLQKDSQCPVCGSTDHPDIVKGVDVAEKVEQEKLKEKLEIEIETLKSELNSIESILYSNEWEIKDVDTKDELEEGLQNETWEKRCNILKESLKDMSNKKQDIKNKLIEYTTLLKSIEEKLIELEKEKEKLEKEKMELSKQYDDIKKELNVENISEKYEKVKKIEEELEKLNEKLNKDRDALKQIENSKSNIETELNTFKLKLENIKFSIKNKKEIIEKNSNEIFKIAGDESPSKLKEEIEKRIEKLIDDEKNLRIKLEELKEKNNKTKEKKLITEESNKILEVTIKNVEEKINILLKDYGFDSIDEVKQSWVGKEEIIKLEKEINEYNREVQDITSNINRVKKLLSGESISSEELGELILKTTNAIKRQSELIEERGKIIEQLNEMKKNIERVKQIKKEMKKLESRKDSLDEIDKITGAKKFVEYVSRSHLNYIAKEATDKLKSITQGKYGLILNKENNFEVIDNHNGGVHRDSKSLSGGETFLVSLALALALSTQIQLKGQTSMELFFLDEGFGTLDVETLDIAMTALENLHTDRLSIGIISHVEEIKNRVPIKLMVSPPQPGVRGSEVNIVTT